MTAEARSARTAAADDLLRKAYDGECGPPTGVALVAVGGYGRGDLAPYSDLDVLLVHEDELEVAEFAQGLWYPVWDAGYRLDHAVRSVSESLAGAESDLRVALGLLDARHVAGDPAVTLRLRTRLLAQWRRDARDRLPRLKELTASRHRITGELAHAAVPDLKEAAGGLRDTTVLAGLVATWLVDVPHVELAWSRRALLDVRDELQAVSGRPTDRIGPELWAPLADELGLADERAAQRHVRELGRRVAHLSALTWRRADGVLSRPTRRSRAGRGPAMNVIAPGLAEHQGEVVLTGAAEEDPLLLLRAAAEAAERRLALGPTTAARLARDGLAIAEPWPEPARQLVVRLLASGSGLLGVWETLDETGALDRILPEWDRIRLLPHASVIHRFTVDRHVIETCIEASGLIRRVARPDLLLVAALLHDIGKGGLVDHSVAGAPIARQVATRWGFAARDVDVIGTLVREHLLLAQTATTRDPDDPATVDAIVRRLPDAETLALAAALTEADALATSAKAWTSWRAGLVRRLVQACQPRLLPAGSVEALEERSAVTSPAERPGITVEDTPEGGRIVVVERDRIGLLADVAAVLARLRITVRGARAWSQDDAEGRPWAVSSWDVAQDSLDPALLRQQYVALTAGQLAPRSAVVRGADDLAPSVVVRPDASRRATVIEVRAADRPGVLHTVLAALVGEQISVRSAHVDTLGPQAVDVFYLQEWMAGPLTDERAAAGVHAVRAALEGG